MQQIEQFDVAVIGGGPAGATAAADLARQGYSVLLLDRAGRIKPCGGAIPPQLIREFAIPDGLLVAKVKGARIVAPSDRCVDMPIDNGFVGMVDREVFDEWLRDRAHAVGATRRTGTFTRIEYGPDRLAHVHYLNEQGATRWLRARSVIGADGALSAVARQCVPQADQTPYVFAYHEIIRTPQANTAYDAERCDVFYNGSLSPDFYSWIFPHGNTISVGTGTAHKGFSLRAAIARLRTQTGLENTETLRREGAPIPLCPLPRWDDGRRVLLAGDAAGVVAPASGEGIYYAMAGGSLAAEAIDEFLTQADPRALMQARRRFMKSHGSVFRALGLMQRFWYANDNRRERFVSICRDRDVQQLTWEAYMNKALVKARPLAHARIFFKNIAHLTGLVSASSS